MNTETTTQSRDTTKARQARSAKAARSRHEKYIAELAEYGIAVEIPENYTGLPVAGDR